MAGVAVGETAPSHSSARPGTVTAAVAVLVFTGVIDLLAAVLSLPAHRALGRDFHPALIEAGLAEDAASQVDSLARNSLLLAMIVSALIGLFALGLALFLHRGAPGARAVAITTCVIVSLCLGGASIANSISVGGDVDTTDVLLSTYPSWFLPANHALTVGQVTGYLSVIVLLLLPASARFFRSRANRDSGWLHHPE